MRLSEYRAFFKEKKTDLLYLLFGPESVLIDRLCEHLKKEILGEAGSEFNFTPLSAADAPAARVLEEAQQLPLLAARRLILIKEADQFSKEDQEELAAYAESPAPSAVMVFVAHSVDKRTRFYKSLSAKGRVLDCSSPPREDLEEWALQRIKREGKEITPAVLEQLVEASGNSLTYLALEIEKLLLYCRDKKELSEGDLEKIICKNKVKTVFNLWDAVAAGKRDEAYSILRELQQEGIAAPELVGLLRWQLSRLWGGRELIQTGRDSKKEVASALGMPFYVVDRFLTQVRQFSEERLGHAYEAILTADEETKGGALKETEVLDRLLYRLMA